MARKKLQPQTWRPPLGQGSHPVKAGAHMPGSWILLTSVPLESAPSMHAPGLPLPIIFIVVLPAVSTRPLALALPPEALVHIPIGVHLLPKPLLQIICPATLQSRRLLNWLSQLARPLCACSDILQSLAAALSLIKSMLSEWRSVRMWG